MPYDTRTKVQRAFEPSTGCKLAVVFVLPRDVTAWVALLGLGITHTLRNWARTRWTSDTWRWLLLEQAVAVTSISVAGSWLLSNSLSGPVGLVQWFYHSRDAHVRAVGYVAVIFGGGRFIEKVSASFREHLRDTEKLGLPNAGKYIGWFERALILTALLAGYGDAIGFLLAAKALARYPELKAGHEGFADYFLIGTTTSVAVALVGGLVIQWFLK